jgi:hypothetical protein
MDRLFSLVRQLVGYAGGGTAVANAGHLPPLVRFGELLFATVILGGEHIVAALGKSTSNPLSGLENRIANMLTGAAPPGAPLPERKP